MSSNIFGCRVNANTTEYELGKKLLEKIQLSTNEIFINIRKMHRAYFDTDQIIDISSWTISKSFGKSSSIFYYFGEYIAKTIKKEEYDTLMSILGEYYVYIIYNKETLLPKFYDLVKIGDRYFVVMNNIFGERKNVSPIYDIKGCNRTSDPIDTILKENNITNKIILDKEKSVKIFNQIKKDLEFLNKKNLIDYSLVIGYSFRYTDVVIDTDFSCYDYRDKKEIIYYIGIVDILQKYNVIKKVERRLKTILSLITFDKKPNSTISPTEYMDRLLNFIENKVI